MEGKLNGLSECFPPKLLYIVVQVKMLTRLSPIDEVAALVIDNGYVTTLAASCQQQANYPTSAPQALRPTPFTDDCLILGKHRLYTDLLIPLQLGNVQGRFCR